MGQWLKFGKSNTRAEGPLPIRESQKNAKEATREVVGELYKEFPFREVGLMRHQDISDTEPNWMHSRFVFRDTCVINCFPVN